MNTFLRICIRNVPEYQHITTFPSLKKKSTFIKITNMYNLGANMYTLDINMYI